MSPDGLPPILTRDRLPGLIAVVGMGLIQSGCLIGTALVVRRLLEPLLRPGDPTWSYGLVGVLVGLALLAAGCRWYERVAAERLGNHYVHELRIVMFRALAAPGALSRRGGSGQSRRPGNHIVRFSNDLTTVRQWVSLGLARIVSAGLFLIGTLVAVAFIDLSTAMIITVLVGAGVAMVMFLGVRLEASVTETRQRRGRLANAVADIVTQVRNIAIFGRLAREEKRLARLSDELGGALVDRAQWIGALRAATDLVLRLIMIAVLIAGAWALLEGRMSAGALLAALSVTALIGTPLRDLSRVVVYWKNAKVARRKLCQIVAGVREQAIPTRRLRRGPGAVSIDGLRFEGLFEIPALSIPGGGRVAILGANGTGKSTLARAITGLCRSDAGAVSLDGVDTRQLRQSDRRRAIGFAGHDTPLVAGSVSKNVRYRMPGADPATVAAACRSAGLEACVADLPRGLATRIGAGAWQLSDGEQARVKLARALLGQPRLLVLDEIDAMLDAPGRVAVERLLAEYPGTVVMVTHSAELAGLAGTTWTLGPEGVRVRTHVETPRERKAG
jgi:ABC-type multidrug transport system fused ATPase/permease subunit